MLQKGGVPYLHNSQQEQEIKQAAAATQNLSTKVS